MSDKTNRQRAAALLAGVPAAALAAATTAPASASAVHGPFTPGATEFFDRETLFNGGLDRLFDVNDDGIPEFFVSGNVDDGSFDVGYGTTGEFVEIEAINGTRIYSDGPASSSIFIGGISAIEEFDSVPAVAELIPDPTDTPSGTLLGFPNSTDILYAGQNEYTPFVDGGIMAFTFLDDNGLLNLGYAVIDVNLSSEEGTPTNFLVNSVEISDSGFIVVPEPASVGMLVVGGLALRRRR
ncbi:MAG: PEP-CTERM sorting domain-containing protein [Planctomycetota bacterium]